MYQELLEEYSEKVHQGQNIDETIFEICGFSHYENVASNVLAFFLKENASHQLGRLFFDSLLEASNLDKTLFNSDYEVEREVNTSKGNYIDICLVSEGFYIVIENKIYAPINNDLDDYWNHAKGNNVNAKGILISVHEEKSTEKFTNITYENFFETVKGNYGKYIGNKKLQYLSLMLDFIENIESINRSSNMNLSFVDFLKQNYDEIFKLSKDIKGFHDDLRKYVNRVLGLIPDKINEKDILKRPWRELPDFFDVAVTEFKIENNVGLAIDSYIKINKWHFEIFVRDSSTKNDFDVQAFCVSKGLRGKQQDKRFYLESELGIEDPPDKIAYRIEEIIKVLLS